ncbi:hypothetical protein N6L24_10785 [Cognatishimia sp. SS12]|uniref:hypothetical protein n=1 Tax=Cognatishimia sp. SS12 TaxID=2979465 RepID=UPI00232E5F1B|nr:hypothetical protein [Cognatishimia sp. SS12]MDC0738767.1 hypothetical protein [Cognatishimia sp. SS12]
MAASVFDSPLYAKRFPTGDAGRLFTESAKLRAILLVIGNLAKVQAESGAIPAESGMFLHRNTMEVQIDPASLAQSIGTGRPLASALSDAFAKELEAPEHSQYLMRGAEAQAVAATADALRLRQFLTLCARDLAALPEKSTALTDLEAALPALKTAISQLWLRGLPAEDHTALAAALRLGDTPSAPLQAVLHALGSWLAALAGALSDANSKADARHAALASACRGHESAFAESAEVSEVTTTLHLPQLCLGAYSSLLLAQKS